MGERESAFAQHARQVRERGKPQAVIQILDSWLRINPDDAGAWKVVREAYRELGQMSEAEQAAREPVSLGLESAESWCDLRIPYSMAPFTPTTSGKLPSAAWAMARLSAGISSFSNTTPTRDYERAHVSGQRRRSRTSRSRTRCGLCRRPLMASSPRLTHRVR